MRISKVGIKSASGRKAVSKAIAKQDAELKESTSSDQAQEAIRLKAYELYLQRGSQNGNDKEDWMEAEKIVLALSFL